MPEQTRNILAETDGKVMVRCVVWCGRAYVRLFPHLTEAVIAAGGQVFRRVSVMRTSGSVLAGPESLDFRSQSQPAPEELLIGNATVLVRSQFPHQLLHRVL